MEQEKKSLSSEEYIPHENPQAEDESVSRDHSKNILVPDDAFAKEESEDESQAELLPQSLMDEEEPLDINDDLLFTDEELASMAVKASGSESNIPSIPPVQECEMDASVPEAKEAEITLGANENKSKAIDSIFDVLEMFVFALAFVLIAMAFFFRHSVVDGHSMIRTLENGEHLIISSLFYTPKQGDIVVVQDASKETTNKLLTKPIVKRVIATEGQTVRIESGRKVYVDGILLNENYVFIDDAFYDYETLEVTVEDGCVFLMGDHRNDSADSRSAGAFKEEAILGKVVLRFLPLQRFGAVK